MAGKASTPAEEKALRELEERVMAAVRGVLELDDPGWRQLQELDEVPRRALIALARLSSDDEVDSVGRLLKELGHAASRKEIRLRRQDESLRGEPRVQAASEAWAADVVAPFDAAKAWVSRSSVPSVPHD